MLDRIWSGVPPSVARPLVAATGTTTTVEETLRYAARRFEAAGIEFRPPRMVRLIRRAGRERSQALVDAFIDRERTTDHTRAVLHRTWESFELYVNGHADPTAHRALSNVQRERDTGRTQLHTDRLAIDGYHA